MIKDHETLRKEIMEANIDFLRLNNIIVDADKTYSFGFKTYKDRSGKEDHAPALIDAKDNKFTASVNQLAGLRIVSGALASKFVSDFEHEQTGKKLQQILPDLLKEGFTMNTLKLKCVGNLKIQNRWSKNTSAPVYRDTCYSGYNTYAAAKRALQEQYLTAEERRSTVYTNRLWSLTNDLRATELLADKATDENLELIPVFSVVR